MITPKGLDDVSSPTSRRRPSLSSSLRDMLSQSSTHSQGSLPPLLIRPPGTPRTPAERLASLSAILDAALAVSQNEEANADRMESARPRRRGDDFNGNKRNHRRNHHDRDDDSMPTN